MVEITDEVLVNLVARSKQLGRHHEITQFADGTAAFISAMMTSNTDPTEHVHHVMILDTEIMEPLVSFNADCEQYHVMVESMRMNDGIGDIADRQVAELTEELRRYINPN